MKFALTILAAAGWLAAANANAVIDAATLTGASTPLQTAQYGVRNYSAPVTIDDSSTRRNALPNVWP